jgi:glycerol-3-phosphate dehydrogenase
MEEPFGGAAPTGPFGLSAEHVFGTDHCEPGDAGPNFEVAHFKDVAARLINARFGRRFGPSRSRFMALIGHSTYPVGRECRPEFLARYRAEAPIAEGLCEAVTDRTADPKGALNHRLVEAQPNPPDTARILFAARFEMAVHLADVVLRRGQHFMPESIPAVAHCLAQERGWTPSELLDEVTALQTEARSPQAAVEPDRVSEGS